MKIERIPDANTAIIVNITCRHCEGNFNAIICHNAFDGPFDNGQGDGGRVQYADMVCALCEKPISVEIPYLTEDEEATLPHCNIEATEFQNIPAYIGRCVEGGLDDV